jgi:predicted nucleic acid-binding protein
MIVYLDDRPLNGLVYDILTVEGALAPPLAGRSVQAIANAPGMWGTSVTVSPRGLAVDLDVWPDSLPDRVAFMDELKRRAGGLRLFRMDDAPDRELYVQLTDVAIEFYHIAIPRVSVRLQFQAANPTRFEREARPIALSTARAAVATGTVPSAPMCWLYGASPSVVNPAVIVRNAAGDEIQRLELTVTLATNDALHIDSARHHIDRYVSGVLQTGTASGNACLAGGEFPVLSDEDAIDGAGVTVELVADSGTPTGLLLYTPGY